MEAICRKNCDTRAKAFRFVKLPKILLQSKYKCKFKIMHIQLKLHDSVSFSNRTQKGVGSETFYEAICYCGFKHTLTMWCIVRFSFVFHAAFFFSRSSHCSIPLYWERSFFLFFSLSHLRSFICLTAFPLTASPLLCNFCESYNVRAPLSLRIRSTAHYVSVTQWAMDMWFYVFTICVRPLNFT